MTTFEHGGPARFAHQREALQMLIKGKGTGAVLHDPGLGKTATVLDFASLLALTLDKDEARVLVVAPKNATDTWVTQADTWVSPQVSFWAEAFGSGMSVMERCEALTSRGGDPRDTPRKRWSERPQYGRGDRVRSPRTHYAHRSVALSTRPEIAWEDGPDALPAGSRLILSVLNIETFSQRRSIGSKTTADIVLEAVRRYAPDLVVVDESHLIKGATSNASKLLGRIAKYVPRRIIMTGTVMPHGPLDVYGQWRFMDPSALSVDGRVMSYATFRDQYANFGGSMGREIIGYKNLEHLRRIMAVRSHVAKKEDALDLPPTTDIEIPVHLTPSEARAYADMKKQLAAQLDDGALMAVPNRLAQMMRLRQITSGYLPDDNGVAHRLGYSKAYAIAELVNSTLLGEKRVVVFCHFTDEIRTLEQELNIPGTEVQVVDGTVPDEARMRYRRRFGSTDPQRMVMIAQVRTMSLAVNELVTASHAVYASLSQQRDVYVQSRDRLNRQGQKRPVTFWHVIAPGTVDQVILDVHRKRGDMESSMLDHLRS